MKELKILNKLWSILNLIIVIILAREFGIKISLLFYGSILLVGIAGMIIFCSK